MRVVSGVAYDQRDEVVTFVEVIPDYGVGRVDFDKADEFTKGAWGKWHVTSRRLDTQIARVLVLLLPMTSNNL